MSAAPEAVAGISTAKAAPEGKQTTMGDLKRDQAPDESKLPSVTVGFTSLAAFQLIWRVAKMFAESTIVPERFRGNPGNCAIAVEMAQRLGASPLMVMQNLYVVYGNPGWSAKFLIACFNQSGRFSSIRYAFEGTRGKDDWGCRAWAIEKETGEKLIGPLINIELSKKEGWYGRKDSKWTSMPEQMLRYRSGAWLINTVAPEISMGIKTTDELEDMGALEARRDAAGHFAVDLNELRDKGAAPATEGGGSGPKEAPNPTVWATTLNGAANREDLEKSWQGCREAFGGNPPNECDAAYQTRREVLHEQEKQQPGQLKL